ncbi:hypothetical protein F4803DRAFT_515006 [Xylaria telfairii]|nr:hypothetical protein F4803DRAFT_515006 [Xylaria telfairii]
MSNSISRKVWRKRPITGPFKVNHSNVQRWQDLGHTSTKRHGCMIVRVVVTRLHARQPGGKIDEGRAKCGVLYNQIDMTEWVRRCELVKAW